MGDSTPRTSHPQETARFSRPRSLPSARPFRIAVFFFVLHILGLIASITALVWFARQPSETASRILFASMGLSAITWLISFLQRRTTYCPLCKGTPLSNSGARTHQRAKRLPPFNHGVTATLSILATQKFRCMYCGSDFDLLKPPSRRLRGGDPTRPSSHE